MLRFIYSIDNILGLSEINVTENVSIKLLEKAVGHLGSAASSVYWLDAARVAIACNIALVGERVSRCPAA